MSEEKLRLLIVGGHPADAFDCAGGTLAHHAAQGDQITALVLTQGTRIHDVVISDELRKRGTVPPAEELDALMAERSQVKHDEVVRACAIMGFTDVRFLTYSDEVLLLNEQVICDIARLIREVRPHIVITHYPFDNGGIGDQHAITAKMVINALATAGSVGRGDPNPPWRVAQTFFMGLPSGLWRMTSLGSQMPAYPDVFVDISDVMERKVRAMDCIVSQQMAGGQARKRAEAVDGCFGWGCGVAYAEAFIRFRPELHYTLPLGPWAVERSNELESLLNDRMNVRITMQME